MPEELGMRKNKEGGLPGMCLDGEKGAWPGGMDKEEVEVVESKLCLFGCQQKDFGKFHLPLHDNSEKNRKNPQKI